MKPLDLPDRCFIAESLRRPTIEYIGDGVEVFVVGKISGDRISMLGGDPSISVEFGRLGSLRTITSAPLNSVTRASAYALADDLQHARGRIDYLERQLTEITAIADADDLSRESAIERIRAVLHPPAEEAE